jgi:hypothetical protein
MACGKEVHRPEHAIKTKVILTTITGFLKLVLGLEFRQNPATME